MPPKSLQPSMGRSTSKPGPSLSKADKDSKAMPPPPAPKRILEEEMLALSGSFKNAMVKTGQIYGFYADTRRLGIQKHVRQPPHTLSAALGREVEKYDQLCDVMESHLLRAIAILERDLKREQQRAQEAEDAAKASQMQVDEPTLLSSPLSARIQPPTPSDTSNNIAPTPTSLSPSSSLPGRRPSAISISSLHRPAFPLKLDLSAPSLRMSPDEASAFIPDGLHSPVTLAPKSARPSDYPSDLIAALNSASGESRVDVDLTLPESDSVENNNKNSNTGMGTADKPIELDLESMDMDMSDLFGDEPSPTTDEVAAAAATSSGVDDLFSPTHLAKEKKANVSTPPPSSANFMESMDQSSTSQEDFLSTLKPPTQTASNPSPGSLLASFSTSENSPANTSNGDTQFNLEGLDYNNFFGPEEDGAINLDQFLGVNNGSAPQPIPKSENAP